jgi:hypothetical protein
MYSITVLHKHLNESPAETITKKFTDLLSWATLDWDSERKISSLVWDRRFERYWMLVVKHHGWTMKALPTTGQHCYSSQKVALV